MFKIEWLNPYFYFRRPDDWYDKNRGLTAFKAWSYLCDYFFGFFADYTTMVSLAYMISSANVDVPDVPTMLGDPRTGTGLFILLGVALIQAGRLTPGKLHKWLMNNFGGGQNQLMLNAQRENEDENNEVHHDGFPSEDPTGRTEFKNTVRQHETKFRMIKDIIGLSFGGITVYVLQNEAFRTLIWTYLASIYINGDDPEKNKAEIEALQHIVHYTCNSLITCNALRQEGRGGFISVGELLRLIYIKRNHIQPIGAALNEARQQNYGATNNKPGKENSSQSVFSWLYCCGGDESNGDNDNSNNQKISKEPPGTF